MTEDEMVGWQHQLKGCEFEQVPGVDGGQGSLACYSPWGHKESDPIEQVNNNNKWLSNLSPSKHFPSLLCQFIAAHLQRR